MPVCESCTRLFLTVHGLETHQGRGCRGRADATEEACQDAHSPFDAAQDNLPSQNDPDAVPEMPDVQRSSDPPVSVEATADQQMYSDQAQAEAMPHLFAALYQELQASSDQCWEARQATLTTPSLETELMAMLTRSLSGDPSESQNMQLWHRICTSGVCRHERHCKGGAGAQITQFLNIFRKWEYASYFPSPDLRSFAAWQEHMCSGVIVGNNFEHTDIGPAVGLQQPLYVSVRKDLFWGLLDIISTGTEQPILFPIELRDQTTQERIYREQHTGDAWLQLQARLHCSCWSILLLGPCCDAVPKADKHVE